MFFMNNPIIWFILQIAIFGTVIHVSVAIAKKTHIVQIALGGMILAVAIFCTIFLMSIEMVQQRKSLRDEHELYNTILQVIPDHEGCKIDESLYENITDHNRACQDAQDMILEHPVVMWFFSGGNIESYEQYMVTIPPYCLYDGSYEQTPSQ